MSIRTEYVVIHHNPNGHRCDVFSSRDSSNLAFLTSESGEHYRTELWECVWSDGMLEGATLINQKGNAKKCDYSLPSLRYEYCIEEMLCD